MTTSAELMSGGMAWPLAGRLGTDLTSGLTATGSAKASALQLTTSANIFTTVGASTGAILPPASGSAPVAIYNGGASSLSVYANGSDTINANSAAAAFSVTNGKAALFIASGNKWVGNLSA